MEYGVILVLGILGFVFTYLIDLSWKLEERLVAGFYFALPLYTLPLFFLSFKVINPIINVTWSIFLISLSLITLFIIHARVRKDLLDFKKRLSLVASHKREIIYFLALIVPAFIYIQIFFAHAYTYSRYGLIAGYLNIWADWSAHLTYAGSFAYGNNFPPHFPIDPSHNFGYPFMFDYFAATLVSLGASLPASLVISSELFAFLFPVSLFLCYRRLCNSSLAASLAVYLFCLSGGLGFIFYLANVLHSGSLSIWWANEYTLNRALNLQWLTPTLAWMIPQRGTLVGYPSILICSLLYLAGAKSNSRKTLLIAGIFSGLLVSFHGHSWMASFVLPLIWALWNRSYISLWYLIPSLALGLPVLLWLSPATSGLHVQWFWLANSGGNHDNPLWFWLKNLSLLLPLALLANIFVKDRKLRLMVLPIWLFLLLPNIYVFQAWDWDNTKYFAIFFLFSSPLIGLLLTQMAISKSGAALVGIIFTLCIFSGGLDVMRSLDKKNEIVLAYPAALTLAEWVRLNTPPDAIFAVAPQHNHPVPMLAGRSVVAGYDGWLYSYGLTDGPVRLDDEEAILAGSPRALDLARVYHVRYVVIGEMEAKYGGNDAFWKDHATRVFDNGRWRVYALTL